MSVRRSDGFTLVELLVVMLIIGLLAAIAVPAFYGQRNKASDADAKVAVRTAQTAAETIFVDNGGAYDGPGGVNVANLVAAEETLSDSNLSVPAVASGGYTVRVQSDHRQHLRHHPQRRRHHRHDLRRPGRRGLPPRRNLALMPAGTSSRLTRWRGKVIRTASAALANAWPGSGLCLARR